MDVDEIWKNVCVVDKWVGCMVKVYISSWIYNFITKIKVTSRNYG